MAGQPLKKLILIGAGGTAADVLSIVSDINRITPTYECIGLLDDNPALEGQLRHSFRVLGGLGLTQTFNEAVFVDCLGSTANYWKKPRIHERLGIPPERFETLVHPRASVSSDCVIGRGTVIYPNVVIMANVRIGQHVTVLANVVMNHDVRIGDFSITTSGVNISGGVDIGRNCYIGTGSVLKQGIRVGDQSLIGMGSVVLRDVPPRTVMAGNPASPRKTINPES